MRGFIAKKNPTEKQRRRRQASFYSLYFTGRCINRFSFPFALRLRNRQGKNANTFGKRRKCIQCSTERKGKKEDAATDIARHPKAPPLPLTYTERRKTDAGRVRVTGLDASCFPNGGSANCHNNFHWKRELDRGLAWAFPYKLEKSRQLFQSRGNEEEGDKFFASPLRSDRPLLACLFLIDLDAVPSPSLIPITWAKMMASFPLLLFLVFPSFFVVHVSLSGGGALSLSLSLSHWLTHILFLADFLGLQFSPEGSSQHFVDTTGS